MPIDSGVELLALHGARVLGSGDAARIAGRYGIDAAAVGEQLLDDESRGYVRLHAFSGSSAWSLTEAGRQEDTRRLAAELDARDAREVVEQWHRDFTPLNARLTDACSRWQLRPTAWDALARNDHDDWAWDERVLDDLAGVGRRLMSLGEPAARALPRLGVHTVRYLEALRRVEAGEGDWVDAPDRDSCHLVWIQLHEDLLSTLGRSRDDERA